MLKRYYIKNDHVFKLDYGPKSQDFPNILTACFIGPFNLLNEYDLTPGYESIDSVLHECPISVFYVQINSLKKHKNDKYTEVHLTLFSKQKTQNRQVIAKLREVNGSSFWELNKCVNALNLYIDNDNKLEELDDQLFTPMLSFDKLTVSQILKWVNQLKMDFFENCQSRVGKDNYYWNEVEIKNLPDNRYFVTCLHALLTATNHFEWVYGDYNIIGLEYRRTAAYSSSHPRRIIAHDEIEELIIKDLIKINILNHFKFEIEVDERLKCEPPLADNV